MERKDELEMINKIIDNRTKFLRTYDAKVLKVQDSEKKGRILCSIPALGWETEDEAAWCIPSGINTSITPKIDDWVRVGFAEGKLERPYYFGMVNNINDMLPTEFDGNPTTQIIYEDNNNEMYIKYDENSKTLTIEDSHGNIQTHDTSGITVEDTNGNKIKMSNTGIKMESQGNTVEMKAGEVNINELFRVLQ